MKKIMKKAEMGMQAKPKLLPKAGKQRPVDFEPKSKYPVTKNGGDNYDENIKLDKERKAKGMMKMGGKMKKAKDGSSLGMKSVKAGYDDNSGVTRADFVSIGKGEAKMGKSVKKAGMHKMPDGSMMKNSMMKMGGAMAKQAAVAIAMKKAGKSPKKKMQYGGEAASMVPPAMMKKGGMMKKCKYGCK